MSNENQLISRILGGDKRAYRAIVDEYQDMVYTLNMKVLKDSMLAEDVSQEVFVKVFRKLETFAGNSSLKTWIFRITYRTALDALRSKRPVFSSVGSDDGEYDVVDHAPSQQDQMESIQDKDQIHRAIDQLQPDQALVVTLYYLEEKKIKEIGKATGFSESKVKVDLHRGRNALKKLLVNIRMK
ncbi:MAG: RNA polymerase sigma factor [Saprospiraceae bacterium]|nr:RNA polymerase sigma factor [Saprospiraceae bacterium]